MTFLRKTMPNSNNDAPRLDKWLWAARFYKTRSIAQQMVSGGKVHYNGQRCKPSRKVELGATILLRQGFDEKEIQVIGLSEKRGNASLAAELYRETAASIEKRQQHQLQRKLASSTVQSEGRPDKKQRRTLRELKDKQLSD